MGGFESVWESCRERAERALLARLPDEASSADAPERLHEAMRYACLNGGKRFRAMLVYACGEIAGAAPAQLDAAAAAVEMVHAYSLVHDDLPAMDDDDLRRGRPSCHIAFDEATAILAGDALQTLAFETLCRDPALAVPAERRLRMIETLARAIGPGGMAGGQALDIAAGGGSAVSDSGVKPDSKRDPNRESDRKPNPTSAAPLGKNTTAQDFAHLKRIHEMKTGALIRAAASLGGLAAAHADAALLARFDQYAVSLGLAFQIVDDILDEVATGDALGKPGGADRRMQKVTYPSVLGLDRARNEAQKLGRHAIETATDLGDNSRFLRQLAHFVVHRSF